MIDLVWESRANDTLADIYVAATPDERETIAADLEQLHRELRRNPLDVGESRAPLTRVVVRGRLAIWFRVNAEATRVRIFHVSRSARE